MINEQIKLWSKENYEIFGGIFFIFIMVVFLFSNFLLSYGFYQEVEELVVQQYLGVLVYQGRGCFCYFFLYKRYYGQLFYEVVQVRYYQGVFKYIGFQDYVFFLEFQSYYCIY